MMVRDISAALRELPVDVAHIGSTAVPGLDAKPIIDIQVGSPDDLVGTTIAVLRSLGFEPLGQSGVSGREYLRRRSGNPVNVRVVQRHGRLWSDNILFRDYLRANPVAAARYAAATTEAARHASTPVRVLGAEGADPGPDHGGSARVLPGRLTGMERSAGRRGVAGRVPLRTAVSTKSCAAHLDTPN